jgi:hypothetical protein
VSHELITPISCIIELGNDLIKSIKVGTNNRISRLIVNTGKLVLAEIKMLLDRNLFENGQFVPQLDKAELLKVIEETVEIL